MKKTTYEFKFNFSRPKWLPLTDPMVNGLTQVILCSFLHVVFWWKPVLSDFFLLLAGIHMGSIIYAIGVCKQYHTPAYIQKQMDEALQKAAAKIEAESIRKDKPYPFDFN